MEGLAFFAVDLALWALFLNRDSTNGTDNSSKKLNYVRYSKDAMPSTLVVDCTHPSCTQITHHLKGGNQKNLNDNSNRGDSTTEGVLNAIKANSTFMTQNQFVTTNHFDIDSILSLWCAVYPEDAIKYEKIVRECSIIGDFRELSLHDEYQHIALKLACWLNSEEKRLFFRPFEGKGFRVNPESVSKRSESCVTFDENEDENIAMAASEDERDEHYKIVHFLPRISNLLESLTTATGTTENNAIESQLLTEYHQVISGYSLLHNENDKSSDYDRYENIGLVVISTPEPLHYYSLFSVSKGLDIVLSMYSENRYELEIKYTSHVDIVSRKVWPKANLKYLVQALNNLESNLKPTRSATADLEDTLVAEWRADRITDSGPILRMDTSNHLTKAERYGNPFYRPIYPSLIDPHSFKSIIISYYEFVYDNVNPKIDWSIEEISAFNEKIDRRIIDWKYFVH